MEIKGKVHCMFEQSGTFKNEFKKLGYEAYDYDIQNNFGETDYVMDLFHEIEQAYDNKPSIFDGITPDDLIVAFFPCIYFEVMQMNYYSLYTNNNRNKTKPDRVVDAITRLQKRTHYHTILYKLVWIAESKNFRLIIENPCTKPHYLIDSRNFPHPDIVDNDRTIRGDYFKKPTAYWFFNCNPTYGESFQKDKPQKTIMKSRGANKPGVCSEERSMISPDYARNWICDFVLGKKQDIGQLQLF